VLPRASGDGVAFLTRIMLKEKLNTAILLIANVAMIPTQRAALTHSTVTVPSGPNPARAKRFSSGRLKNAQGNSAMVNLYMIAKSNVRSSQGIVKSCNIADVKPEAASEYPISSAGRDSPPEAIGEKQNSTNTTSNALARKLSAKPDKQRARTRGLPIRLRMLEDELLRLISVELEP